ncbi:tRNA pseudouridine(55) synthase TruB [bacterium]|jgi:tRNA pseudouridine55 synthase|nr:tRNA pseudouridine(55) synthase TruB [bacterium]
MRELPEFHGLVNFHKPPGVTSADCVSFIKRLTGAKKVGHGGTLDPFADGVLPIGINRGTRLLQEFISGDKTYAGYFRLGYKTDTLDVEGKLEIYSSSEKVFSLEEFEEKRQSLVGTYEQKTPHYSARKVQGKKLYELARKNQLIEGIPGKRVTIYSLDLGPVERDRVNFSVTCSKGTYVRQLVQDFLEGSEFAGTLEKLTRTRVGPFEYENAVNHHEFFKSLCVGEPFSGSWCMAL